MTALASQDVARSRAAMIRAGIQNYLHTLAHIAAAYQQRDWKALGYGSWDAYVDGEYSEHRLKLSTEHRQKAVAELRLAGMSQRAIGSALGISAATVNRDLGTVADETVPDRITGVDGREQPATRPDLPAARGEADAQLDAAVPAAADEAPIGAPAPVGAGDDSTGNDLGPVDAQESAWAPGAAPGPDGQTSGPGVPDRKPSRRPLPDAFRDTVWDLVKVAERLDRLTTDDRFPRNAEQVARVSRGDLLRAVDLLATVVDRLRNPTKESTE